jgi:hypothetical protein
VNITVINYSKSTDLQVTATSNAPANSVTLTAFATTNGVTTTLGTLKYKASEGIYRTNFSQVTPKPDSITVTSSGGGTATGLLP